MAEHKHIDSSKEDMNIVNTCTDIPYLCTKCRSLLAFVDSETKSRIRVKSRDLYLEVIDPKKFTITCRGCGFFNTLEYIGEYPATNGKITGNA